MLQITRTWTPFLSPGLAIGVEKKKKSSNYAPEKKGWIHYTVVRILREHPCNDVTSNCIIRFSFFLRARCAVTREPSIAIQYTCIRTAIHKFGRVKVYNHRVRTVQYTSTCDNENIYVFSARTRRAKNRFTVDYKDGRRVHALMAVRDVADEVSGYLLRLGEV
jgi:hypothetical protein